MKILSWLRGNYLLVLILLIAAALRFIAVKPGYNQYHGDETAIWGGALTMVRNSTLNPGRYDYPAATMLINAFAYNYFFIPLSWLGYYLGHFWNVIDGTLSLMPVKLEADRLFSLYIVGERGLNAIFWARYVTAFFGAGTVFLTYLLSKKMFTERVGLLAAIFLTFNYRNVVNSHLALPDVYNAFFLLLAFITSWNLLKKPSRGRYLLAGIAAGLSFSIKYQFFGVLPLILIHLALTFKDSFSFKKLFDPRVITAGLCILLVFLLANPYFFIYLERALASNLDDIRKYGFGTNTLNLFPLSYLYHIDYGPLEFALVILGICLGLFKKTAKSFFLLGVIVPIFYVFIYYTHGGFYVRNFIPVTPLLLIFASYAFWQIFGRIKFLFLIPVIALIIYIPAKNSIISSYAYTLPWDYEVLQPWIGRNLPKDAVVGIASFDKPLLGIANKSTDFAQESAFSLAEHKENGDAYVVVDLNLASETFYSWMNYGVSEASQLWTKPVEILENTFHGLAAEELFRNQIKVVAKPWQSPDMHFVVVKIPDWPTAEMKTLKTYTFDSGFDGWTVVEGTADQLQLDTQAGHLNLGSLVFAPSGGGRFPIQRVVSTPIEIKGGHLYEISGYLKIDQKLKLNERNGFLRVDFYASQAGIQKHGEISAVSSRLYGSDDWTQKSIIERAPDDAKYLTVSFQVNYGNIGKIWLDDLVIKESLDKVEDIRAKAPYTKDFIDLNYLFPNSHGNL